WHYGKHFISNPAYLNRSLLDSAWAYWCVFFNHWKGINFYNYIQWDEDEIVSTIVREFNWETEPDTISTWRIDDGTAAFYNYVYMAIAGFNENEAFRSVQIRNGELDRQKALELVKEENKPRFQSLEWYADTIGFDCNRAIKIVNSAPRLYRV
ncbi:MAG: hypothetical protein V2B18_06555, partial [Pseudomonadota bacterium]